MGAVRESWRQARHVQPGKIAKAAQRPFTLLLVTVSSTEQDAWVRFLIPEALPAAEREQALQRLEPVLAGDPGLNSARQRADAAIASPAACAQGCDWAVELDIEKPRAGSEELLRRHGHLLLALGRRFPPLRAVAARGLVQSTAMRNAGIAALTAIPEVVPTPLGVAWALGEFASDSVLLSANQVRLAMELAALYGAPVGWGPQSPAILAIVGGAFGWRAAARAVVALIPAGVGLAAKSGIAYGGTLTVGGWLWHRQHRRAEFQRLSGAKGRTPGTGPRLVQERLPGGHWRPRNLPELAEG